jgi:hypothetical protein
LKPEPFDDRYYQGPVLLDLVKDGVAYFSAEAVGHLDQKTHPRV